ncbi:MAG: hypothetical protein ACOYON_02270 [Fimbriimonas sp.]
MSEINAAKELATWTRRVCQMYGKDLKAISNECYVANHGGVSRTVQDFTAEVAGMNMAMAGLVSGAGFVRPSDEESAAFKASLDTAEAGAAAVVASGEALASAIESASPEKLSEMTQAPWGEPMSIYALANIAANHVMYHDGQLTYVQCLNNDPEMHWFDA